MEFKTIRYEKDGGIARITLNRPEALNAMDLVLREEFRQIIFELKDDPDVRVVVISGEGSAFCAGGDLKTMGGQEDNISGRDRVMRIGDTFYQLANLEKPVIAAVNGVATGAGLSIVLSCDITIASDKARFGAPFVKAGLVPDTSMTYFLPRVVGLTKARQMIISGEMIDSAEAYRIGLVTKVVPHEQLESEVTLTAEKLASGPTKAMAMAKIHLLRALDSDLKSSGIFEAYGNALLFHSIDHKEAVDSFVKKRKPRFIGR